MTTRNERSSVYNKTHCGNTDNYTNKRLLKDATMVPHMGTINIGDVRLVPDAPQRRLIRTEKSDTCLHQKKFRYTVLSKLKRCIPSHEECRLIRSQHPGVAKGNGNQVFRPSHRFRHRRFEWTNQRPARPNAITSSPSSRDGLVRKPITRQERTPHQTLLADSAILKHCSL
jgi:hypothetical protein